MHLISEYQFFDEDGEGMPIITLEVMSEASQTDPLTDIPKIVPLEKIEASPQDVGVHFLTDKIEESAPKGDEEPELKEMPKGRSDLLEYVIRTDGRVICKLCGEILQSRTHWYRHKYKLHVIQPLNPAPLFQCEQCLVYFKSRKGKLTKSLRSGLLKYSFKRFNINHTQNSLPSIM